MSQKLSYCGDLVRDHDPDKFLLSMFAPAGRRDALWALFAFNHEIAKTREVVTETQLGLIRLQWWRERLAEIYDGQAAPEGHKILESLAFAIEQYDLPHKMFETLLYAREFDLEDMRPANPEGLLNYADFTAAPLFKLAVQIAGGDPETEPVQPVAVNYALAGLIRAAAFHARQRRCYLPETVMEQHGISLSSFYKLNAPAGLKGAVKEVADYIIPGVRPEMRFLKAAQALSEIYKKQLRRLDYNAFHPRLQTPPALKVARLLWAVLGN